MYTSLIEKLAHTKALKWFPNHQVEESWIVEVEQELGFCYRLPIDGGFSITGKRC